MIKRDVADVKVIICRPLGHFRGGLFYTDFRFCCVELSHIRKFTVHYAL